MPLRFSYPQTLATGGAARYADQPGLARCKMCPENSKSEGNVKDKIEDCYCEPRYYTRHRKNGTKCDRGPPQPTPFRQC